MDKSQAKPALTRSFDLLRALATDEAGENRLTDLARRAGLTPSTALRLLRGLINEGMVDYDEDRRQYRLGIEFFTLAARAGNPGNLRDLCRPVLLRLSATLHDTLFLLVRSGFDAVCLDRSEGPFPIRSFTGDIGGRVIMGVGQGSVAILAFLPEAEREEVIRFNLPRLYDQHRLDEVFIRGEIAAVRKLGYASRSSGLLPGMAGIAVPILDREGKAVAALSMGTTTERLNAERMPIVADILKREAETVSRLVNPFDPVLRRPAASLSGA
ncbi:IclR family transcriptional regulator [Ferrovibrio terrae]|uniref:IclR family transcriptional regulator n=1 Tax=Ferrovibrio terrae TaxID=2594003 RepID=UPI0031379EAA